MSDQGNAFERLRKELNYYERQLDELTGENVKLDMTISGLRHELRQKVQGFALLSELQQSMAAYRQISSMFEIIVPAINATLGMDKTVVLTPTDRENCYRPSQWLGPGGDATEHLSSLSLAFPPEFAQGSGLLVVNKSSVRTPLIDQIQRAFDLPYFVCLPVMVDDAPIGLLLSGRLTEARPFYPPLDQGDVDTFQAIAGLISASVQNRRVAVLEEMDRLKTEFFANISHEFRTPITLTLGPLAGILAGRYGGMSDAIRDQVLVMQRNQGRLLGLINQILDLAKLEAGSTRLQASPIPDMNRFVAERVGPFRSLALERGIELRVSLDPRVRGAALYIDREKFDKLLYNLLSNAIKFTKQGYVEVSTEIHEEAFRLTVTDTGIGIKTDQIPYIFDRFRQADGSASREYGGTGLGLTWVKEVAELHGGGVTVHSQYGKGSSFRVHLPLGKAHLDPTSIAEFAEEDLPAIASSQGTLVVFEGAVDQEGVDHFNEETRRTFDPGKPTILYAEDNRDMRNYIKDLLAARYNVFLAVDGRDGLDKTVTYRPDLILADHMMPNMSGLDFLREVRGDPDLRSIPVIFVTARAGTEARIESLEAQADDYLTKPFDEQELLVRIRNLLRARAQEQQLAAINRRMERELRMAREVQASLLPRETPQIAGWEFAARWEPAREVAGDYYDFIPNGEGRLGLVIADVCDKGMPAALFMALTRSIVRASVGRTPSPAEDITYANRLICADSSSGMFVTLFYALLDPQRGEITYVNAGHNPPLLCKHSARTGQGQLVKLPRTGMALGVMADAPYEQRTAQLDPGDLVLCYTDGVTDATDTQGREFGMERVQRAVLEVRHKPAAGIVEALERAIGEYAGSAAPLDDIAIVVIKCRE